MKITTLMVLPMLLAVTAISVGGSMDSALHTAPSRSAPGQVKIASSLDVQDVLRHVVHLSKEIGPRPTGSGNERTAGDYIASKLRDAGCDVSIHPVKLRGGRSSRNIVGRIPGLRGSSKQVIICAHYDTVSGSPGANDNASGVGVMLELARTVPQGVLPFDLLLIGFGAEEIPGDPGYRQRYGSGKYASSLSKSQLRNIMAVVSLDMVGAGDGFKITNGGGDMRVVRELSTIARGLGASPSYIVNATSDHSAFESRGIPAARLRWWPDNNYHRRSDTIEKIDPAKLSLTGKLMLGWLKQMAAAGSPG